MGRPDFWRAFSNTLIISFLRLLFGFPAPIILALLINEVRRGGIKRVYQTVYTFPHFLSWVLVAGVMVGVLGSYGVLNQLIVELGGERIIFLIEPGLFRGLLVGTEIWKSSGWGSIIFLAAIAGIDPQLYEAATIDGAGRWKSLMHITWPGIKTTAVILLILQVGNILNAGFDQIFNLYNPAATAALSSAPSTLDPSVCTAPSRSTGCMPAVGRTVSVCAHSRTGCSPARVPVPGQNPITLRCRSTRS